MTAPSSSGRTSAFEADSLGSNPSGASPVRFYEGKPLAPMPPDNWRRQTLAQIREFRANHGLGIACEADMAVGLNRGWLAGWHAGFSAASVGRNAKRQDRNGLGPKDEHAVPHEDAGDAHNPDGNK